MKIRCVHGFFFFDEESHGELSAFLGVTGFDLVPKDHYFTFAELQDAPDYSIKGVTYIDSKAIVTYAGKPWEVMEANGLVFDFVKKLVRPIAEVTSSAVFDAAPSYFYSDSLILPGGRTKAGDKVTGYTCFARADATKFRYTEIDYE